MTDLKDVKLKVVFGDWAEPKLTLAINRAEIKMPKHLTSEITTKVVEYMTEVVKLKWPVTKTLRGTLQTRKSWGMKLDTGEMLLAVDIRPTT